MGSVCRGVERGRAEQIIMMIRQSLVLATVLTISYSQSQSAFSHQYQFNDGGRRRFARRVSIGMEPSDRNILEQEDGSSRREFSPIFGSLSDFNSPYLMIDSEKFTVLPAVPNLISQRSEKSLNSDNNQNFLFPSTQHLKPIPAVPPQKTTSRNKVKNPNISSRIPVTPPPSPPPRPPAPSLSLKTDSGRETRFKLQV